MIDKMKYFIAVVAICTGTICAAEKPVEWEHGYKTSITIGTRTVNPTFGEGIGINFSERYWNYADETGVLDIIENSGCAVLQNGGYPGAEIYALCKDVHTRDDAGRKLLELIPKLDQWMKRRSEGR